MMNTSSRPIPLAGQMLYGDPEADIPGILSEKSHKLAISPDSVFMLNCTGLSFCKCAAGPTGILRSSAT